MKIKMKKYGKMSSIFEFSIPKVGYTELFRKNLRKKRVFLKFLPAKGHTRTEVSKGFNLRVSQLEV